jgi:PadR family transcriptional regulator PadR
MGTDGSDLSFMNGVPELLVLQLLERREMYGYEIVRAIGEATGKVIDVGEGCVYPILHAMEKRKWVSSRRKAVEGRTRIYYALTARGKAQLLQTTQRWARITSAVNAVLGGAHESEPATV